jgi:molybdopterin converting factor small subunit
MRVTVHYFAQVRRAAGCAVEEVDVDAGLTIGALLDRLATGQAMRTLLLGVGGAPHVSLLGFVGDQPASPAQALYDGDEITILAPMAGG